MTDQPMHTTSFRTTKKASNGITHIANRLELGSVSELMRMIGENSAAVIDALQPLADQTKALREKERQLAETRRKVERELRAELAQRVRQMSPEELAAAAAQKNQTETER